MAQQKLANRYFGPFQIIAAVGVVAYKLSLPDHSRVRPVFHVSLLKRKIGDMSKASHTLPLSLRNTLQQFSQCIFLSLDGSKRGQSLLQRHWCNGLTYHLRMPLGRKSSSYSSNIRMSTLRIRLLFQGGQMVACPGHVRVKELSVLIHDTWSWKQQIRIR